MHMCSLVTFIQTYIITKQTPACQAQAEVVVCQLDYEKAPERMAGVQIWEKVTKVNNSRCMIVMNPDREMYTQ